MKRLILTLLVAIHSMSFSPLVLAVNISSTATSEVLSAYLKIQDSLANDSMNGVSAAAAEISKNTQDASIKTPALALAKSTSLDDGRTHFKALSIAMDKWAKSAKPEGVDRVSCPMVKAPWLQKHGAIKNPYYGKKMQSCGEVQK